MKHIIALLASILMGAYAQAYDLNSTVSQLTARYGKPTKVERSWYGIGMSYGFQPNHNLYVYATTNPSETRVEDVIYIRFHNWANVPFTSQEAKNVLQRNLDPNITWKTAYPGVSCWDGVTFVKHLGREYGLLQVWDINYSHSVIGNTRKLDVKDSKGNPEIAVQVRTSNQFWAEQAAVKTKSQ